MALPAAILAFVLTAQGTATAAAQWTGTPSPESLDETRGGQAARGIPSHVLVFTRAAVVDALDLYRVDPSMRSAIEAALETYLESMRRVDAAFVELNESPAMAEKWQLYKALTRPQSEQWVMFPGLEGEASSRKAYANPLDPAWTRLEELSEQISASAFRLRARLRDLNRAFLRAVTLAGDESDFEAIDALRSRLMQEALEASLWSRYDSSSEFLPGDIVLLMDQLGSTDVDLALDAVGVKHAGEQWRSCRLEFEAAAWDAIVAFDSALLARCTKTLEALPPRSGFSGLGGNPTARQVDGAHAFRVRTWEDRFRATRRAMQVFVAGLDGFPAGARLEVAEALSDAHLAYMTRRTPKSSWRAAGRALSQEVVRNGMQDDPHGQRAIDQICSIASVMADAAVDLIVEFALAEAQRSGQRATTYESRRSELDRAWCELVRDFESRAQSIVDAAMGSDSARVMRIDEWVRAGLLERAIHGLDCRQ